MGKKLDDVINELSKEWVPVEKEPEVDLEKIKEREFFFGKPKDEPETGNCSVCGSVKRIHLSTFFCDECAKWRGYK